MKHTRIFLFIIIAFCFCYSCTYEKAEPQCYPPDVVSYHNNIQPIFDAHCTDAGCHSGPHPEGGLNLTAAVSYNELMARGSGYIDTLNPEFSVLYAQINSVSNPMPPDGKLDKCTIDLVLKWIRQKAKNN